MPVAGKDIAVVDHKTAIATQRLQPSDQRREQMKRVLCQRLYSQPSRRQLQQLLVSRQLVGHIAWHSQQGIHLGIIVGRQEIRGVAADKCQQIEHLCFIHSHLQVGYRLGGVRFLKKGLEAVHRLLHVLRLARKADDDAVLAVQLFYSLLISLLAFICRKKARYVLLIVDA